MKRIDLWQDVIGPVDCRLCPQVQQVVEDFIWKQVSRGTFTRLGHWMQLKELR